MIPQSHGNFKCGMAKPILYDNSPWITNRTWPIILDMLRVLHLTAANKTQTMHDID